MAFYIKTIVDFWINSCRSGIRSDIFKTALQGLADYSCNHLRPQILLYLRYADGRDLIPKESDSVMESFKGNILAPCIQYSVVQNINNNDLGEHTHAMTWCVIATAPSVGEITGDKFSPASMRDFNEMERTWREFGYIHRGTIMFTVISVASLGFSPISIFVPQAQVAKFIRAAICGLGSLSGTDWKGASVSSFKNIDFYRRDNGEEVFTLNNTLCLSLITATR